MSTSQLPGGLTAVPGVRVAHVTLTEGEDVRTGVTAILPAPGPLRERPLTAAVHVINGYGKPVGLAQVQELGELEAPVVLTCTLGVGAAHEGAIRWLLDRDPDLGRAGTVNPVVLECNDGVLNDQRRLAVRPEHVVRALDLAEASGEGTPVDEGAVGAGHGMIAFGHKGGIGTASRRVDDEDGAHTLGVLVLSNMGRAEDLAETALRGADHHAAVEPVDGSIVVVIATDAPWDSRQLGRLARRAQNGLARLGVATDHGSGEFVLAFSTAEPRPRRDGAWMRPWFHACADAVAEAVLRSMRAAVTTTGRNGVTVHRHPGL